DRRVAARRRRKAGLQAGGPSARALCRAARRPAGAGLSDGSRIRRADPPRRCRLITFSSHCLSLGRHLCYLAFTLCAIPVQALAVWRGWQLAVTFPMFSHARAARILGFRVEVRGRRVSDGPILFVANHASYADMEMFGSTIPGSFIAKSEVAGWPLFGLLAKLQRSV